MTRQRRTSAEVIRMIVAFVCVATIVGMIASAVTHHLGGVVTLGCVTVGAIAVLLAVGAVTPAGALTSDVEIDDVQSRYVESLVNELVAKGAPEDHLRNLVGEAVRLGSGTKRH